MFAEPQQDSVTYEPDWAEESVDLSADQADVDTEEQSTHANFEGDEGGLDPDGRRALVVLLKNRFITSESHPREWKTILASRQALNSRLNDMFLELEVNTDREVAYKRSASGSGEFPTLLHDTAWPREETALLVYLRVRARSEQARGEAHVRISYAELVEYLHDNRPESATDQVVDERRAGRAITSLKRAGLLVKTNEDGVFRVSPAIEPMLPMPTLTSLLAWLNVGIGASDSASDSASEGNCENDGATTITEESA